MLDFNNKKNTLRALRRKGEQNLFWRILCGIAAVFVRIGYDVACAVSMIFSDKHGNLFGIRGLGKGAGAEARAEQRAADKKARRQDDIVYVKKPMVGRLLSAILAISFVFMFMPDLGIDLGLGFSASAAISSTIEVVLDGVKTDMYRDIEGSTNDYQYLIRASDYKVANEAKVNITKYEVGYGVIRVTWELASDVKTNLEKTENRVRHTGFHVEVIQNGSIVNGNTEYAPTKTQDVFYLPSTGDVYLLITPTFSIKEYVYAGSMDDINSPDANVQLSQTATYPQSGVECGKKEDAVTPNATFKVPEVRILDDKGNKVPELDIKSGNSVSLTWDEAVQTGGATGEAGVKTATGYRIYMSTDGGPFSYYQTVKSPGAEPRLPQGHTYRFFVEAYRNVWEQPDEGAWSTGNAGLISSSRGQEALGDDAKATSIYTSDVRATAHIAPIQPVMEVTSGSDNNSYLISVKNDPVAGTGYSGVYLFRTTSEQLFSSYISAEDPNYDGNFGEWLVKNCSSKKTVAGIEVLPLGRHGVSGNNTTITYPDRDIIAGVQYYYYAVAYLDKGDNTYLYSYGVEVQSTSLELNLGTPLWVSTDPADGQVTLTWEPVRNADGYELEIIKVGCHDDDEDLPKNIFVDPDALDVGNKTTYVHSRLYNDDRYQYRVRAYINVKAQQIEGELRTKYYSSWSSASTVTVGAPFEAPQNVRATTVDGAVTVTWDAVPGASVYTLFYTNLTTGESGSYGGLTRPTYTHTNLINGDRIQYYVIAYKNITGDGSHGLQRYASDISNYVTIKVGEELGIPQDLKAETKDGEITVTWSAVAGAEGYILEYRQHGQNWDVNGTNGRAIDLSRTSYNHTRLTNGEVYEYRVKAYKTVSGERVYSEYSVIVSMTVGNVLDAPKDLKVETSDGKATLTWTAVTGAEGYIVYASSGSRAYQFDVSKTSYEHTGLVNGETWTYYVEAYKTVNAERSFSKPTQSVTVTIGDYLNSALDLTATAGNHQIDLSWTAVKGAEGYVVYLYNSKTMEFEPIAVVSGTNYSHVGLKNGTKYTYMVAPFKTTNGTRVYGDYSITVTATPTTGSPTDIDRELNVKGTAPYGISHGEYISADCNHEAFDESVDVYFTTNKESTQAVKDVLKNYANGLSSFVIYPFDISIYKEGTKIEVDPADGFTVTITMPIPDILIAYRDYLTVVHINDHNSYIEEDEIEGDTIYEDWYTDYGDQRLEVLPCAIVDIDNIWCIQFKCSSFSPYAFVIYKEHIQDVSSGWGVFDGSFAGTFNTGGLLLFTALPDILPQNKKLRVVRGKSRRYRIKNVEKK